jgi:hypothetical protein
MRDDNQRGAREIPPDVAKHHTFRQRVKARSGFVED